MWRSMTTLRTIGCAALVSFSVLLSTLALAADQSSYPGGFVVAHSRFGNGVIKGQVRATVLGWEVLLPGGHWVYCRRNCAETLRVETLDFFNANGAGSGQLTNECGLFGCLDLKYGH